MPAGIIPSVPSAGFIVKLLALHIAVVRSWIAGIGLTVTVTLNVAPIQVPDVGVTVYVAVPELLPELESMPLMFAPPPANPPDTVPV